MSIVTSKELADAVGVSVRRIQQYVKQGMPGKVTRDRYTYEVCKAWIDDRRRDDASPPMTLNDERQRLARVQADSWEIKLQATRGVLMLVATHEQHLRGVFAATKSSMNAWVSRATNAVDRSDRQRLADEVLTDIERRVESMCGNAASGIELTPSKIRNAGRLGG